MIKRLFWDLETSPNIGFFWRAGHKQFVNYDSIITERAIICVGYKWEGDDEIHSITWDKEQSDKALLERFLKVVNEADELVAHNGDRFDLPWLRTRCLFHGLPIFPNYKTADTLQWAKRKFYFNSNRMDYIASFLGFGGKIKTELGLWKSIVMKNDRKALADMVTYCKRDVQILEQVWSKMELSVPHKTNAAVAAGLDKWACPKCASVKVKKSKTRITAAGTIQHQMQCRCCGRTYSINNKAHSDYLEAKKP